jgi:uncharacterized protein (DUF58 family)
VNARTHRRWTITSAGLGALVVAAMMLAAGLIKTINLLILLGDLLVVLVLINAALARASTHGVTVERLETPRVAAQRRGRSIARVMNRASRATAVSVEESTASHRMEAFVPGLAPGTNREVVLDWPPTPRGLYDVEPLRVGSGYPFGFIQFHRTVSPATRRTVSPATGTIEVSSFRRWLIRAGAGDARERRPVARQSPHQADVRGVRAYRIGDNPRHIHWRSTARRNELLVRDYDRTEPLDLLVVFNPNNPERHQDAFEDLVSLTATIIEAWCKLEGSPHVVVVIPGDVLVAGRANAAALERFLAPFAVVNSSDREIAPPAEMARWNAARSIRLHVGLHAPSATYAGFVTLTPKTPRPWYRPPPLEPADA